jgi:hypothetical protein
LPITIPGTSDTLANAINAFSATYHADFFRVRKLGQAYVTAVTPSPVVTSLALLLREVLVNWGAGMREAPTLQSLSQIENTLAGDQLHTALKVLHSSPITTLTVVKNRRSFISIPTTQAALNAFDNHLFFVLRTLGSGLFRGNTNATYPMKAVLLITGLMPAFDSQVRRGLQRGGFTGMNKTQYLLPDDPHNADGLKIARLPFLLGECWSTYANQISAGIMNSRYPQLLAEPGRFFDAMLFMQGDPDNPVLISYQGSRRWYDSA